MAALYLLCSVFAVPVVVAATTPLYWNEAVPSYDDIHSSARATCATGVPQPSAFSESDATCYFTPSANADWLGAWQLCNTAAPHGRPAHIHTAYAMELLHGAGLLQAHAQLRVAIAAAEPTDGSAGDFALVTGSDAPVAHTVPIDWFLFNFTNDALAATTGVINTTHMPHDIFVETVPAHMQLPVLCESRIGAHRFVTKNQLKNKAIDPTVAADETHSVGSTQCLYQCHSAESCVAAVTQTNNVCKLYSKHNVAHDKSMLIYDGGGSAVYFKHHIGEYCQPILYSDFMSVTFSQAQVAHNRWVSEGTTVNLTCNEGQLDVSSGTELVWAQATCLHSKWSNDLVNFMNCTASACKSFQNSSIAYNETLVTQNGQRLVKSGTEATFKCPADHLLLTDATSDIATATCNVDKTWSDDLNGIVCQKPCAPIPKGNNQTNIQYNTMRLSTSGKYEYDTVATVSCAQGTYLVSTDRQTSVQFNCSIGGEWTGWDGSAHQCGRLTKVWLFQPRDNRWQQWSPWTGGTTMAGASELPEITTNAAHDTVAGRMGDTVYFVNAGTGSVHLINVTTGRVTSAPAIGTYLREQYAAVELRAAGAVLVCGGVVPSGSLVSTCFTYNASTGAVAPRPSMPVGLYKHAMCTYRGRAFAIGGTAFYGTSAGVHSMDATSLDAWRAEASLLVGRQLPACAEHSGALYVCGGLVHSGSGLVYSDTCDMTFDGTYWIRTAGRLPSALCAGVMRTIAGTMYYMGGWDDGGNVGTVYVHNDTDGTWTVHPRPLATGVNRMAAVVVW